jgi:hypothetical protein
MNFAAQCFEACYKIVTHTFTFVSMYICQLTTTWQRALPRALAFEHDVQSNARRKSLVKADIDNEDTCGMMAVR